MQNLKNKEPRPKFTGSYEKKKRVKETSERSHLRFSLNSTLMKFLLGLWR